nr:MAG TPA: hypothetical protein [Caudoviricetes sp.]
MNHRLHKHKNWFYLLILFQHYCHQQNHIHLSNFYL